MATGDGLTPKQHKCLAALLAEPTIAAAAARVHVGERTVHTWLLEPTFADAYRVVRRLAVGQAISQLQQASSAAVGVLCDVMTNADERGANRVAAARAVLDYATRAIELEDLEARIALLETASGST